MISLNLFIRFGKQCILKVKIELFENITANLHVILLEIRLLPLCINRLHNTTCRSHMTHTVDQDQLTESLILFKLIQHNLIRKTDPAQSDLILLNCICMQMLTGIYIRLKFNTLNHTCDFLCAKLHKILLAHFKSGIIHPEKRSLKALCHWDLITIGKNTATAYIHLFIQLDCNSLACNSLLTIVTAHQNRLNSRCLVAWKRCDNITYTNPATLDLALEAAKFMVWTRNSLNRQIKLTDILSL